MNANESGQSLRNGGADQEMTAERSIEIIRNAIERNRHDTNRCAGVPLVMWGTLCFFTAMVVGHLANATGNNLWQLLWLAAGAAGWVGQGVLSRRAEAGAIGFVGNVVGMIWLAFAVFCFSTFIVGALAVHVRAQLGFGSEGVPLPITPVIIMMMGVCAMIMGLVLRNAWITTGAIVSGVVCAAFAMALPGAYAMIALAVASVLELVVPGVVIMACARR